MGHRLFVVQQCQHCIYMRHHLSRYARYLLHLPAKQPAKATSFKRVTANIQISVSIENKSGVKPPHPKKTFTAKARIEIRDVTSRFNPITHSATHPSTTKNELSLNSLPEQDPHLPMNARGIGIW